MFTACQIRLYPTDDQLTLIRKSGGSCRFLYNRLLDYEQQVYESENRFVKEFELNAYIRELRSEFPWLSEVNAQSLQQVSKHVAAAYKGFFEKRTGFPKYKAKHRNSDTFTNPQHCRLDFRHSCVVLPKLGPVKAVFHRRLEGTLRSVTVSVRPSGHIYASLLMDDGKTLPDAVVPDDPVVLGIDVGLKDFAVCSDGTVYPNIRTAKRHEKRLQRLHRELSRKVKGSSNRNKARIRLAKEYERISNIRNDYIHKVTHEISENQADVIAIEDLNVKGMMRNRHLARGVADVSLGEFRRQLEYKCARNGKTLVVIPRYAASTQTCHVCGYVNRGLKGFDGLHIREWTCPECSTHHDRDMNAALMIAKLGIDSLPVGHGEVRPVELPSVDDRTRVPKKHDSDMREAGTVQGAAPDDRPRDLDTGRLGAR